MKFRKKWYRSKTLWFNGIMAGLAAAEASAHLLAPITGDKSFAAISLAMVVGNAFLRVISTEGLTR